MSAEERIGWACVVLAFALFGDVVARGGSSFYGRLFCWIAGV